MGFAIFLLLLTVLGAGAAAAWVPVARGGQWLKPLLAFSGAYLFTLTVTHILPEALQLLPEHPTVLATGCWPAFLGSCYWKCFRRAWSMGTCITKPPTARTRVWAGCRFCCWSRW